MAKFSFNVGKKEFHTVVFKINKWLATYKVIVDGQPIKKGSKKIASSYRRITFEVGGCEKHKILIVLESKSLWEFEAKVSINGRLRDTYFL